MDDEISLTVNGEVVTSAVEDRTTLADLLRDGLGLTGTHLGCEQGACGACTVLIDGASARSCLVFARQLDGCAVTTVEGLGSRESLHPLQAAFQSHSGLQCGFCTPGFLMTAVELLAEAPGASREDIRVALSGNVCRCTGYEGIVDAIAEVAARDGGYPKG